MWIEFSGFSTFNKVGITGLVFLNLLRITMLAQAMPVVVRLHEPWSLSKFNWRTLNISGTWVMQYHGKATTRRPLLVAHREPLLGHQKGRGSRLRNRRLCFYVHEQTHILTQGPANILFRGSHGLLHNSSRAEHLNSRYKIKESQNIDVVS